MQLFQKLIENSAIVLIGPPLSGEKELLYQYILSSLQSGEPVLLITTDKSPESVKKEFIKNKVFVTKYETEGSLKYIDCYSHQTEEFAPDTECIKRISGPLALNELSIALSDVEKEFIRKNPKHKIIFNSLSTVLLYSNPQMVGRFVQVLVAKIKKAGGSIIFTIEEGMHDKSVIITIEHLMDAIIDVKKEGTKVMVKGRGIEGFEDWKELNLG